MEEQWFLQCRKRLQRGLQLDSRSSFLQYLQCGAMRGIAKDCELHGNTESVVVLKRVELIVLFSKISLFRLVRGGVSAAARHALEGSPVVPGNEDTLNALRDEERRLPLPHDRKLKEIFWAARPFQLDKDEFLHCLRTTRRGAAGGPGMKTEHLRPLFGQR